MFDRCMPSHAPTSTHQRIELDAAAAVVVVADDTVVADDAVVDDDTGMRRKISAMMPSSPP